MNLRKGTLYLNNLGCALLEHGAFDAALETLQDAVFIMKNGVCAATSSLTFNELNLAERLHLANQRVAFPQACRVINGSKVAPFAILALQDYFHFKFEAINFHANQFLMCPVRIEDDNIDCSARDYDLDSGTLLSNLGLAYACLSKCYLGEDRFQLQTASCRVFQMADTILHHSHTHSCEEENDCEILNRATCINMVCLHGLMQALIGRQGEDVSMTDDVADTVLERLYFLQRTLDRHDEYAHSLSAWGPSKCHAAAA